MLYLQKFISALLFTDVAEAVILFFLLWFVFKKREIGWPKIIIIGLFASFATLPYVWFVFPSLTAISYALYLTVAELFALIIEAVLYRYSLDLTWKVAFLLSFLCNLASLLFGLFISIQQIWIF